MQPHPCCECARMRVQTGEGRQQGGMDVDQTALVMQHEGSAQDPHEAGKDDQIRRMAVDLGGQCGVESGAVGIVAVAHHPRGYAMRGGDFQPFRLRLVADDTGEFDRQASLQQGLHIAATAGDEDDDFHVSLTLRFTFSNLPTRPSDSCKQPWMRCASARKSGSNRHAWIPEWACPDKCGRMKSLRLKVRRTQF